MKKAFVLFLTVFILAACTKNKNSVITGTVIAQQSCTPDAWLVRLDKPNYRLYSFLCNEEVSVVSSASLNCGNSVFILNMPPALAQDGKKVKFSVWEDKGLQCFSSNLAPHHLQVADLAENN